MDGYLCEEGMCEREFATMRGVRLHMSKAHGRKAKYGQVGFLQLKDHAIDHTPILFFAITKPVKAGTMLRFDMAERIIESVEPI